jgi:hypothetical protein
LIVTQTIGQVVPLVGRRRRASLGNAGGSFVRGAGVRLPIVERLVDVGADGANVVPSSSMDTMRRRKTAAQRSRRAFPAGWRRGPRGLREGPTFARTRPAPNRRCVGHSCIDGAQGASPSVNNDAASVSDSVSILTAARVGQTAAEVNRNGTSEV